MLAPGSQTWQVVQAYSSSVAFNWTTTGLCTQVNNGIRIDSPTLAAAYRTRWDELTNAGAGYPATLAEHGSTPASDSLGDARVTAWS